MCVACAPCRSCGRCLQSAGLYATQSGDKLMGWPNWCQGPEWAKTGAGQRYLQVVQVRSGGRREALGQAGGCGWPCAT